MTLQYDLFSQPSQTEPIPTLETRACGTCGGKGSYKVLSMVKHDSRGKHEFYEDKVCPDCNGTKMRTVTAKPDCPDSAKTYGMETGILVAMTAFTREMKRQGYGAKVETGGDLDARKARQCCNALLHNVASDRPEPTAHTWQLALAALSDMSEQAKQSGQWEQPEIWQLHHIEDDPDPDAHGRKLRAMATGAGRTGK